MGLYFPESFESRSASQIGLFVVSCGPIASIAMLSVLLALGVSVASSEDASCAMQLAMSGRGLRKENFTGFSEVTASGLCLKVVYHSISSLFEVKWRSL